ncbi:hypothetical protein [Sinomonas sp. RB5]
MSYDQQPPHQQPWPAQPAAPWPAAGSLLPQDAEKSRRWRLVLGCSSLFLALASGFYASINIASVIGARRAIEAAGRYVPASAMALAAAIIGVFCLLALAYAGIGAWNIAARRSTAKAPLIAAIVLAGAAFVLIVFYMATRSTGGFQLGGLALNALIVSRAVTILRMKKTPAYPAAARWTS